MEIAIFKQELLSMTAETSDTSKDTTMNWHTVGPFHARGLDPPTRGVLTVKHGPAHISPLAPDWFLLAALGSCIPATDSG